MQNYRYICFSKNEHVQYYADIYISSIFAWSLVYAMIIFGGGKFSTASVFGEHVMFYVVANAKLAFYRLAFHCPWIPYLLEVTTHLA